MAAIALIIAGSGPGICSEQAESEEKPILNISADLIAIPGVKERLTVYAENQRTKVEALAAKYLPALEAKINSSADAGDIEQTLSFQDEKKRVEALLKKLAAPQTVPFIEMETLGKLSDDVPKALVKLRGTWNTEQRKIQVGLAGKFQKEAKELEIELTKARDFDAAKTIMEFRQALADSIKPVVATADKKEASRKQSSSVSSEAGKATKSSPFENSLGMRFVPVPISGGRKSSKVILFSVWEVRVSDYKTFSKKNSDVLLLEPRSFVQKETHPVVNVSWNDAGAFCTWLTEYDRKKGKLGTNERYRLPTDHEWSCAYGVGSEEDPDLSPNRKNTTSFTRHHWGEAWPPPKGSGNYYGEETKRNQQDGKAPIEGYSDGFEHTAPVGSFEANSFGIYDMSGNVDEWCEEWYSDAREKRVVRGASWYTVRENFLRLNYRNRQLPNQRSINRGFRCVLEVDK